MKYYKRLKEYKASNVCLRVEPNLEAYSYAWWLFLTKYKGLIIFNNTNYSPSTLKHQSKVRGVLDDLNIKIDIELNHTKVSFSPNVTIAIRDEIDQINLENKDLALTISKPRTRKSTNLKRKQQISQNKKQIKKLEKVLRSEK